MGIWPQLLEADRGRSLVGALCLVGALYYPEELTAFERELVEAQQAAHMETCLEDNKMGQRMDAGRKALLQRGDNEVGPHQKPMEAGMQHFHGW